MPFSARNEAEQGRRRLIELTDLIAAMYRDAAEVDSILSRKGVGRSGGGDGPCEGDPRGTKCPILCQYSPNPHHSFPAFSLKRHWLKLSASLSLPEGEPSEIQAALCGQV